MTSRGAITFNLKSFHGSRILRVFFRGVYDGPRRKAKQQLISACQHSKPLENYKCLTMDDMPLPYGNWKEHHAKRNRYYNRVLLLGFCSLAVSVFVLKETVFFNALPPPYPFEEEETSIDDDTSEGEVDVENKDQNEKN